MGGKLVCPECEGKLRWDGRQYCCVSCPWTEHKAKPPSDPRLRASEQPGAPTKPDDPKN